MRIQLAMPSTGIAFLPGLSKPVTIDSDRLSAKEAADLKELVAAAHFFDLPPEVGAPSRGAADYVQYTITVEDKGQQHTVHLLYPPDDPKLQALLATLKKHAATLRAAGGDTPSADKP